METVDGDERSYEEEIAEVSPLNVIAPASPASTSSAVEKTALSKPNASQKMLLMDDKTALPDCCETFAIFLEDNIFGFFFHYKRHALYFH